MPNTNMKLRLIIEALNKTDRVFAELRKDLQRSGVETDKLSGKTAAAGRATESLAARTKKAGAKMTSTYKRVARSVFSLKSAIVSAAGAAGVGLLAKLFIDAAASMERTEKLLEGVAGSSEAAARGLEFIYNLARETPFHIDALKDTFVKLSVAGLDPAAGSMQALLDAVANFGGSSEDLKLASVAIQQMAGKGVISMEELRRQLGERVPSAIKIMAREMGLSIKELIDTVSAGELDAKTGLAALFRGFERDFTGATDRMMKTWLGLTSRLGTEWMLFRADFMGQSSIFDYMEAGATTLIDDYRNFRSEVDFKGWAKEQGNAIIDGFERAAIGMAIFADKAIPALKDVKDKAVSIWEIYDKQMPEWARPYGVIGAILLGKKGIAGLAATLVLIEAAERAGKSVAKAVEGTSVNDQMMKSWSINQQKGPALISSHGPTASPFEMAPSHTSTTAGPAETMLKNYLADVHKAFAELRTKGPPADTKVDSKGPPAGGPKLDLQTIEKMGKAWDVITLASLPKHEQALEKVRRKYWALRDSLPEIYEAGQATWEEVVAADSKLAALMEAELQDIASKEAKKEATAAARRSERLERFERELTKAGASELDKRLLRVDKWVADERKLLVKAGQDKAAIEGRMVEVVAAAEGQKKQIRAASAQAIREAAINAGLAEIDLAEKERSITKGQAVAERLHLYRELLTVQQAHLGQLNKLKDPSGWHAQSEAIAQTREQVADLTLELAESAGTMADGFGHGLDEWLRNMDTSFQQGVELAKTTARAMESSFSDLFFDAVTGKLKSLGDYVASFLNAITRSLVNMMAQQAAGGLLELMPSLGSFFGGGRAAGGPTAANMVYEVTEVGPELLNVGGKNFLMMGNQPGFVTPLAPAPAAGAAAAGSGGGETVVNLSYAPVFQAVPDREIVRVISEQPRMIVGMIQHAFNRQGRRGPNG